MIRSITQYSVFVETAKSLKEVSGKQLILEETTNLTISLLSLMLTDSVNPNKQCTETISKLSLQNSKLLDGKLTSSMDIITMKSFQPFKSQDKKMESPKLLSLILSKASISPKFKISEIGMVKLLDKILKKSSTTLEAL